MNSLDRDLYLPCPTLQIVSPRSDNLALDLHSLPSLHPGILLVTDDTPMKFVHHIQSVTPRDTYHVMLVVVVLLFSLYEQVPM